MYSPMQRISYAMLSKTITPFDYTLCIHCTKLIITDDLTLLSCMYRHNLEMWEKISKETATDKL